ncbi:MAG: hypothetical protein OEX02_20840 [Cyclobacteriaceae bacterium]|nr:hypothetical protein [Cyclobacteriaceae bacterium]
MKYEKSINLFQIVGSVFFFGGILTSIVINNAVGDTTDVDMIYYYRQFVSDISYALTIPGMWVAIIATFVLFFLNRNRWLKNYGWLFISFLMLLVLLNGMLLLTPLVKQVSLLAHEGFKTKILPETYQSLKGREDMLGAINFLMGLFTFVFLVYKNPKG